MNQVFLIYNISYALKFIVYTYHFLSFEIKSLTEVKGIHKA